MTHSLDDHLRRWWRDIARIPPGTRVLVGVSGGGDSVALLHAIAGARADLGVVVVAAHVDHAQRPGSAGDATFVSDLGRRLGVEVTSVRLDTLPETGSPEERLRDARRTALGRLADAHHARWIALGHTRDDQAETVVQRAAQGTSVTGLAAMRPITGRWLRPFLGRSRAELRAYLDAHEVPWRDDPTNEDPAFLRNRIRHRVLPTLDAELNPRSSEALARLAEEAGELDDLLRALADDALDRSLDRDNSSPGTEIRLVTDRLRTYHAPIRRVTLRLAYERLRGSRQDLGRAHLSAIDRLLFGVGSVSLPGGVRAVGEQGRIRLLGPLAETGASRWDAIPLVPPGEMDLDASGVRLTTYVEASPPRLPGLDERHTVVFDADRLALPLVVRPWRAADRFRPLGMDGRQKLSDLFTNLRVARSDRSRVPLLTDGEGILWVIGHRRSNRAPVGPDTRRVLRIEAAALPRERGNEVGKPDDPF